jgi:hypothetical protein
LLEPAVTVTACEDATGAESGVVAPLLLLEALVDCWACVVCCACGDAVVGWGVSCAVVGLFACVCCAFVWAAAGDVAATDAAGVDACC